MRRSLIVTLLVVSLADAQDKQTSAGPDEDQKLSKMLDLARIHNNDKQAAAALEECDKVIDSFEKYYAKSEHKINCARSSTESLAYQVIAAAAMNKGEFEKGKKDQIILPQTWADAYFVKSYALQELGRIAEAKAEINKALALSPSNSLYLSELGSICVLQKDWPGARRIFRKAEEDASLSPENARLVELGQARRGTGYVLVELGLLDEAEKKYKQCLADEPNDKKAKTELEYVRGLKAKKNKK
jgi:Flp pilus assembly protein TadD